MTSVLCVYCLCCMLWVATHTHTYAHAIHLSTHNIHSCRMTSVLCLYCMLWVATHYLHTHRGLTSFCNSHDTIHHTIHCIIQYIPSYATHNIHYSPSYATRNIHCIVCCTMYCMLYWRTSATHNIPCICIQDTYAQYTYTQDIYAEYNLGTTSHVIIDRLYIYIRTIHLHTRCIRRIQLRYNSVSQYTYT